MEPKGRRASRAVEPIETPPPMVEPAEPASELSVDAASALPAPDAMAPTPVNRAVEDMPEPSLPAPVPAAAPRLSAPQDDLADFGREARHALAEARSALADGFEALSDEVAGFARCGIDTAARTAIEMLAIRTVGDAIAVNAEFARANLGNWVGGSAKFSELGIRVAADTLRPFVDRLGRSWVGICRVGF
jgi:phasin protein